MNRPGESRSLAARTTRAARRTAAGSDRIDRLRRRHCWVLGEEPDPGPWPGLVAEWRRAGDGWLARVVYVVGDTSMTTEEWLPAARLRPATWPADGT
jgi:hypothetical protein